MRPPLAKPPPAAPTPPAAPATHPPPTQPRTAPPPPPTAPATPPPHTHPTPAIPRNPRHETRRKNRRSRHPRTRFSLLCLEYEEYYLQDFGVTTTQGDKGRLKVCSRSLVFEPDDVSQPVVRFPFASMPEPPISAATDTVTLQAARVVHMLANGDVAPHVTREAPPPATFSLLHTSWDEFAALVLPLHNISATAGNRSAQQALVDELVADRKRVAFNVSLLADFRERLLLAPTGLPVQRITPLLQQPGCVMLTDARLYYEPAPLNNTGEVCVSVPFAAIKQVLPRRHMMRPVGLEVVTRDDALLLAFDSPADRDSVLAALPAQAQPDLNALTRAWQQRELSNFEYLSQLNTAAGRSEQDLVQYPVFPWVVADYTSERLDLSDPRTFRDLSKPIGALNAERLAMLLERYETMDNEPGLPPPFLYGTHYSTPGYVLYYLVRKAPEHMLCLQNGSFDHADRMFYSIAETWRSVLQNPADLKELVPEFYSGHGDFLLNERDLPLGVLQSGQRLHDVELPPWAASPEDFVRQMRAALESDHVSAHLHEWIDLIFGCKQRSIDDHNVFHHLTYEGAVDLDAVESPAERAAIEAQIREFGQTPSQLFREPHVARSGPVVQAPVPTPAPAPAPAPTPAAAPTPAPVPPTSPERDMAAAQRLEMEAQLQRLHTLANTPPPPDEDLPEPVPLPVPEPEPQPEAQPTTDGRWAWTDPPNVDAPGADHQLHRDAVTSLRLTDDTLFSTGKDGCFKVVDRASGRQTRNFQLSELATACCAVAPAGNTAFVGAWDSYISCVSVEYGRVLSKLPAHEDSVSCLDLCDDATLASGAWDSTVRIWSVRPSGLATAPELVLYDHDAAVHAIAALRSANLVASGGEEGAVVVNDLRSGSPVAVVDDAAGSGAAVVGLVWLPELERVVAAHADGALVVLTADGLELARHSVDGLVAGCAGDGRHVVLSGADGRVRVLRLDAGGSAVAEVAVGRFGPGPVAGAASGVAVGSEGGVVRVW